jgi:hypothetical protein
MPSYERSASRPAPRGRRARYLAAFEISFEQKTMGKYVLGWFLGVPLVVLVAIYFIAH